MVFLLVLILRCQRNYGMVPKGAQPARPARSGTGRAAGGIASARGVGDGPPPADLPSQKQSRRSAAARPAASGSARALRSVARGRPGPRVLVTDAPTLRRLRGASPEALAALTRAAGVERIELEDIVLDLFDVGHRALWGLVLRRLLATGAGDPSGRAVPADAPTRRAAAAAARPGSRPRSRPGRRVRRAGTDGVGAAG